MSVDPMFGTQRLWHGLLRRGITLVIVVCVALVWPIESLKALLLLGAVAAMVIGVLDLESARVLRHLLRPWWALALPGLLAIALGLLVLAFPLASLALVAAVLAVWLLAQGVVLLQWAVTLRHEHRHAAPLFVAGLLSVALAVTAFGWPEPTLLALLALMAGYALVMGLVEIGVALWLRAERPYLAV